MSTRWRLGRETGTQEAVPGQLHGDQEDPGLPAASLQGDLGRGKRVAMTGSADHALSGARRGRATALLPSRRPGPSTPVQYPKGAGSPKWQEAAWQRRPLMPRSACRGHLLPSRNLGSWQAMSKGQSRGRAQPEASRGRSQLLH